MSERHRDGDVTLGQRERRRLFETLWSATLWAAFAACAIPWYFRLLPIDLAPPGYLLAGVGVLIALASPTLDRIRRRSRLIPALVVLHLLGIAALAVVWQLVGGLENPGFLVVLLLPIVVAGALSTRWLPPSTALCSLGAVVVLALWELPELRGYAGQRGLPVWNLPPLPIGRTPFPALTPTPTSALTTLAAFTVAAAALTYLVDILSERLSRLSVRLTISGQALERAESLTQAVIRASPEPSVLLRFDDLRVLEASDSLLQSLLVDPAELDDRSFVELVDFAFPEIVEALLRGRRDDVPFVVYRVRGESRFARIHRYQISHGDELYLSVTMYDVSDLYYLRAALEEMDEALVVLSVDDRIVYSNRRAGQLLGELAFGQPAADALAPCSSEPGWWRLGPRRQRSEAVQIAGTRYRASVTGLDIPGEQGRPSVLRLARPETDS